MHKAIFLDKDGTLIKDVPYNVSPEKIAFLPYTFEGLKMLQQYGYLLFVVSNQSGVARGLFDEQELDTVVETIDETLERHGIRITDWYFCPHHPAGVIKKYTKSCLCRKPLPGLLRKAAKQYDVDVKSSWMIGDILDDIEAGNRAGCKSVLINNGNETLWEQGKFRKPFFIADTLNHAAVQIMQHELGALMHL